MYRAMGFAHATIAHHLERLQARVAADERGQGTVEYIGLVLLMAAVMAIVATSGNGKSIGTKVLDEINGAIQQVSSKAK